MEPASDCTASSGTRVSIDPAVSLLRTSGDSESGGLDGTASSTAVVLTLGISTWLGGASARSQDEGLEPADSIPTDDGPVGEEDESSFSTEVSSGGVVSRNTLLANDARLLLSGHPARDGARVLMKLSLLGMAPAELRSWRDCTEARLIAADKVFPLQDVSVAETGFGNTPSLQATASVGALVELVRTDRAVIEICSDKNLLGSRARRALLDFLKSYKQLAERHGTWDPRLPTEPAEPAPVEVPPAEHEDPETPAPDVPAPDVPDPDAPAPDVPDPGN